MRWIVGILLVLAAVLKSMELYVSPAAVVTSGFSQYFTPLIIGCELGLGLAALANVYWRQLRPVVIVMFVGFGGYSLWLALRGAASCGCFGHLEINPRWTLLVDVAILTGLIWESVSQKTNPMQNSGARGIAPPVRIAGIAALSVVTVIGLAWQVLPQVSFSQDGLKSVGNLTFLEPETWVGKQFPLK